MFCDHTIWTGEEWTRNLIKTEIRLRGRKKFEFPEGRWEGFTKLRMRLGKDSLGEREKESEWEREREREREWDLFYILGENKIWWYKSGDVILSVLWKVTSCSSWELRVCSCTV